MKEGILFSILFVFDIEVMFQSNKFGEINIFNNHKIEESTSTGVTEQ